MASTEQLKHPIPDANRLEWYDQFLAFASSIDEADYSARDDRNVVIFGGGTFAVSAFGNVTWTEDVTFRHGTSGFNGTLSSDAVGILLGDGDWVYADLVRGPAGAYPLTPVKASGALPATNKAYALMARFGNVVWIRHLGFVILGGAISTTNTQINVGEKLITVVPLVVKGTQGEGLLAMGRLRLNVADYALANATMTLNLRVEWQVSEDLLDADFEFYDATSGDVLKASSATSSDQPAAFEAVFVPVDVVSDRVYELRAGLDPLGAPYTPDQEVIVWHAAIEVINTF